MKYCKIIELNNDNQVLVKIGECYEEEDAPFTMEVETHFDSEEAQVRPSIIHRFKSEKKRNKAFEKYDKEGAEAFRKAMFEQVKSMGLTLKEEE